MQRAIGAGWKQRDERREPPELYALTAHESTPWTHRVATALGLQRTFRIYGLEIAAPPRVVSKHDRRKLLAGRYESMEAAAGAYLFDRSVPVVELGAGIGVVSCFVNGLLDDPRKHVAIEADACAYRLLLENLERNGAECEALHRVVAYDEDAPATPVPVLRPPTTATAAAWDPGHLGGRDDGVATTLTQILDEREWATCNLLVDIEGRELDVFTQEAETLRDRVVSICVEMHPYVYGPDVGAGIVRSLVELGFEIALLMTGTVIGLRKSPAIGASRGGDSDR